MAQKLPQCDKNVLKSQGIILLVENDILWKIEPFQTSKLQIHTYMVEINKTWPLHIQTWTTHGPTLVQII